MRLRALVTLPASIERFLRYLGEPTVYRRKERSSAAFAEVAQAKPSTPPPLSPARGCIVGDQWPRERVSTRARRMLSWRRNSRR